MAILPDRLHHHQRGFRRDLPEDFHAATLAIDEAVAFDRVTAVAAAYLATFAPDGVHHGFFRTRLRRPAFLIRRQAQISTRNQYDRFGHVSHFGTIHGSLRYRYST